MGSLLHFLFFGLPVIFVLLGSIWYFVDFLQNPTWSVRRVFEIAVFVLFYWAIIDMSWHAPTSSKDPTTTTGEPDYDDPANISPAERVRRLQDRSKNPPDDALQE